MIKVCFTILFSLFFSSLSYCQISSDQWLLSNNNVIHFNSEITITEVAENVPIQLEGAAVVNVD